MKNAKYVLLGLAALLFLYDVLMVPQDRRATSLGLAFMAAALMI